MTDLSHDQRRVAQALLILRLTLAVFLLQWSLEKFITPEMTARIFEGLYGFDVGVGLSAAFGVGELLVTLGLFLGYQRRVSYGLAIAINVITALVSWRYILDPFGLFGLLERPNHLFISSVPIIGGYVVMYLLRDMDYFSLDAKLARKS